MASSMLSDCLTGNIAEEKHESVTGNPLSEKLLKMEEGGRLPLDLKAKSKRDMYLKFSDEPAVDSEMPKLSEIQEQLCKIQDMQDLQVKTIQRLRCRSMILAALVLLLMIAMSAVTYQRSQRLADDVKNLASANSQGFETKQSKLEQTIAAATQRMDQEHSDWSKAIATVNHNVDAETSARAQAIAAVKTDLNASIYSESSHSMQAVAGITQRMEQEHSDWSKAIATVNHNVDAETSAHAQAIAAVEKDLNASIYSESSKSTQAVAAISHRMEQEHSDWTKAVDAESSTRAQDIEAMGKRVDKESNDQGEAMAGLGQRVDITQAKIQGGMCTYCFSCGGQWPVFMGEITEAVKDMKRRGSECGGELASDGHGMRKNSFCCATV